MAALRVRREKVALSSGCKSHPAIAPAGSNSKKVLGGLTPDEYARRLTEKVITIPGNSKQIR